MEHVTLWVATEESGALSVPDHVIMQIVRLRQWRADLQSSWDVNIIAPDTEEPTTDTWYRVLCIEDAVECFVRNVAVIGRRPPWFDRSEDDFQAQWRRLRKLLGTTTLPDLELINALKEFAPLKGDREAYDRAVKQAQLENIRRLKKAKEDLLGLVNPQRTVRISAYRFNAGDKTREVTLAWNYPRRWLSRLRLPIFGRKEALRRERIEGMRVSTEEVLEWASDVAHDAVIMGSEDEGGAFRGTVSGFDKFGPEKSKLLRPYWSMPPLIRWRASVPISEVLGDRDRENLTNMAQSCTGGDLGPWHGVETQNPPLVMTAWEDSGIWEEYQRIERVWQSEERSDELGTVRLSGRSVPVTVLFGGASLVLWDWARTARRQAGSLLEDTVVCPRCGKQWPRRKRQHRRKLCDNCASGRLRRVRKHRHESVP